MAKKPTPRPVKSAPPQRWPASRRLRVFAFDPSLSIRLDFSGIDQATISVPWETGIRPDHVRAARWQPTDKEPGHLQPGPIGEYIEVVDYDPASASFYDPVDLNAPQLLAQDGLTPSEGNPQFHQQMVYAVAMRTIEHFEQALGRRALWSPRPHTEVKGFENQFVRRLRIYPHALREANAYYSPQKKALLFGYFPAAESDPVTLPGGTVFTCLSHDIIAHETTHALLDGIHPDFQDASNPDVLAFHEAFADLVAMFQHFTMPEALRQQIARTRGDLGSQNLLGELAQQFGQAAGGHGALRSAIGGYDDQGRWKSAEPGRGDYEANTEPHARGAVLVAAVFDAFLMIYRRRIADLLRIASAGTGVLPQGDLHPDLVGRLAKEAAKTAGHILNICIRSLDYCPPVDITFGDFLRALITADRDGMPDDDMGYRLAFIEAFRRRGIYPREVRSLAEEFLVWSEPKIEDSGLETEDLRNCWIGWDLNADRLHTFVQTMRNQQSVHQTWLKRPNVIRQAPEVLGITLEQTAPASVFRSKETGLPSVNVRSFRPARRIGPRGEALTDIVLAITQRRRGYFDPQVQEQADLGQIDFSARPADFIFRGGCTLQMDLDTGRIRYCALKRILSEQRLRRQAGFLGSPAGATALRAMYFGRQLDEPFAFLHTMC